MTNSQTRQEFVACFEAFYWNYGIIPKTPQEINVEYRTKFTKEDWEDVLSSKHLIKYFEDRGVPNPYAPKPVLSPKQMDFLRLVTDPLDPRPLGLKLKQVGATQGELSSWMRDETFVSLCRDETDRKFSNSRTEVYASLAREAINGNLQAQKLYLELTGEYTPNSKTDVTVKLGGEVREATQKILEVLQRHVPPETLLLIHGELEQALFPELPTSTAARPKSVIKVKSRPQAVGISADSEISDLFL